MTQGSSSARSGQQTWPSLLVALLRGEELSTEDTAWAMSEIVSGAATPVQIASFAVAMRADSAAMPAKLTRHGPPCNSCRQNRHRPMPILRGFPGKQKGTWA